MPHRAEQGRRRRRDNEPEAAKVARTPSATPHTGPTWKDVLFFAVIVLGAFALRLIYVLQMRDSPLFDHPSLDELYHDQWGQAIASGATFVDGPYFRAPLYPAFLAAVYKVFGHGYLAPRVVQAVIGSLSCGLLFLVGRSLFGRAVGAAAGFAAASYWMLVYFDGELLIPPLIVFLDLLLVLLLLRAARTPGKITFGLAGVMLGLSAIARPNILLFGPAIVIWITVVHRHRRIRAVVYAACLTVGCLLVVLPITIRNYVAGHDTVLIASQGGVNFYIGNNPQSDGLTAVVPGTPGDWWGGYFATIERAEQALGRSLEPSEVSGYYYGQAWEFVRGQPREFLTLLARKVRFFWSRWEIANNKSIYFWTERFTPVVELLPLGFGVVGPLGILGLVLCFRRRPELFPLWGFVLVYMLSVVLFFCPARYRVPVLPALILLAVYAVFQAASAVRRRRWRAVMGGLAVLTLATVLVNVAQTGGEERYDYIVSYAILGDAYERNGDLELAADAFQKTLEHAPGLLTGHLSLGRVLHKLGRLPEAVAELRRAVAARPMLRAGETTETVAMAHFHLAGALAASESHTEALEHYRISIELDPEAVQGLAQFRQALLLIQLHRSQEALAAFDQAVDPLRAALRINPDSPRLLYALGRVLFAQGRYDDALAPLRECVRVVPGQPLATDCLGNALVRTARYEEAVRLLRHAVSPSNPQLTNRLAFLLASVPDDRLREGTEALTLAQQVCTTARPLQPTHLDTLAVALAETGRFDEAANTARRALDRARRSILQSDRDLIEPIAERLRLYESGRPYRLPQP